MFHLTTHAFFKALLFLGAGSVIHAVHSQDIWEMGGLLKKMPWTGWTFLIGTLALCGIFPLSGFWSKDEILALAFHKSNLLFWISECTAFLTALYMGRLCFVVFFQPDPHPALPLTGGGKREIHESPWVMRGPLVFLAALSAVGGFFGIPHFLAHGKGGEAFSFTVAGISTASALAGLALAFVLYYKRWLSAEDLAQRGRLLYRTLVRKFYVDEIYDWLVLYVQQSIAVFCMLFDRFIVMGLGVNGTAWVTRQSGAILRRFQTGRLQTYAVMLFLGLTLLLYQFIVRGF